MEKCPMQVRYIPFSVSAKATGMLSTLTEPRNLPSAPRISRDFCIIISHVNVATRTADLNQRGRGWRPPVLRTLALEVLQTNLISGCGSWGKAIRRSLGGIVSRNRVEFFQRHDGRFRKAPVALSSLYSRCPLEFRRERPNRIFIRRSVWLTQVFLSSNSSRETDDRKHNEGGPAFRPRQPFSSSANCRPVKLESISVPPGESVAPEIPSAKAQTQQEENAGQTHRHGAGSVSAHARSLRCSRHSTSITPV